MKSEHPPELDGAQNVLNRMKRNYDKGIGIRISADELASLALTSIGEMWEEDDPRTPSPSGT